MKDETKVAVYAECCNRAGEVVSQERLDEMAEDSPDLIWLDADGARAYTDATEPGPHGAFLRRCGRNAMEALGLA